MTLEELYKVNYDVYVKKYGFKTGSTFDAEDIVQEAFTRALTYWNTFDSAKQELSVWFSTILHNCWRDYQRDKRDGGIVRGEIDENMEEQYSIDLTQNMHLIHKLIESKKGDRYDAVRLHYLLGYTAKEISHITSINNHSIRTYISDFRKEVEEMFN